MKNLNDILLNQEKFGIEESPAGVPPAGLFVMWGR